MSVIEDPFCVITPVISFSKHPWDGRLIPIYKPAGMTSFQVVRAVRNALGKIKVGHGGTLDPFAEGVLVLGIGNSGTKRLSELLSSDKEYIADIALGVTTDTDDLEGRILETHPIPILEKEHLKSICDQFKGELWQRPPMYSALKFGGKPLYHWARRGILIEPRMRKVVISQIDLLEILPDGFRCKVVCSGGTYIRSLARDIGERLGCGGFLRKLIRTRVGNFTINQSLSLAEVLIEAKRETRA